MASSQSEKTFTPTLEWAQDNEKLYLKVLVTNVKEDSVKVNVTEKSFTFSCTDSQTNKKYQIGFEFCHLIDPKITKTSLANTRHISIVVLKNKEFQKSWAHLLAPQDKKRLSVQTKRKLRKINNIHGNDTNYYLIFMVWVFAIFFFKPIKTKKELDEQNYCKVDWELFNDDEGANDGPLNADTGKEEQMERDSQKVEQWLAKKNKKEKMDKVYEDMLNEINNETFCDGFCDQIVNRFEWLFRLLFSLFGYDFQNFTKLTKRNIALFFTLAVFGVFLAFLLPFLLKQFFLVQLHKFFSNKKKKRKKPFTCQHSEELLEMLD
ncbi:hypothetical protein RFI_21577 [Reticulomyxa filosa]|uniref:CS domain-containing protein n=1 Tax=Reticulomyxa filosa TaxID=46433 RepID=X6MQ58_RETFI|nr:hypothetical protein RFI_21577 [Reticulomyxa filosa]|eukprot:ETO15786.1 hypothetical protein RFI_21577 [Reticulomyxa filosa]